MKILLIEPNSTTCEYLSSQLLAGGQQVSIAQNSDIGCRMIQVQAYDIAFLSSDESRSISCDPCQTIREEDLHVPILIYNLTQKLNYDPFNLSKDASYQVACHTSAQEMLIQMRVLTKCRYLRPIRWLNWAGLNVNLTERIVYRNERGINLTERECHLLALLMWGQGQVLQRDFIIQQVWACTKTYRPNTLDVYISYLRKKVDKNFPPKLIQTVVGIGYKLAC